MYIYNNLTVQKPLGIHKKLKQLKYVKDCFKNSKFDL